MTKTESHGMESGSTADWHVYILVCADQTLYTGIAQDLPRRLEAHGRGLASKYTRSRLPVELVHHEMHAGKSAALRREAEIKRLDRAAKLALIAGGAEGARRADDSGR